MQNFLYLTVHIRHFKIPFDIQLTRKQEMFNEFPELEKAIKTARTIELPQPGSKKYKFKTLPFGERGTKIEAKLLKEITNGMVDSINKHFPDFDYIVSHEPGGHTWGIMAALKLNKSINILRAAPSYEMEELEVRRKTGYYQQDLYFNHFQKGEKVLIIDDVISTGGTVETILETLSSLEVKTIGVQAIYAKSKSYKKLEEKYSIPIKLLIS